LARSGRTDRILVPASTFDDACECSPSFRSKILDESGEDKRRRAPECGGGERG
jgi:hypothetical protein